MVSCSFYNIFIFNVFMIVHDFLYIIGQLQILKEWMNKHSVDAFLVDHTLCSKLLGH